MQRPISKLAEPATQKQLSYLQNLGYTGEKPATKRSACTWIQYLIQERDLKEREMEELEELEK